MNLVRCSLAVLLFSTCVSGASGQDRRAANPASAPPYLLVLVHQEIQPGKAKERQKLEVSLSRACDRLEAPSFWIGLQSLSGLRDSLFFTLFDSFEQLQQSHAGWKQFYAAHADLAQTKTDIDSLVVSERTVVAVRRDDLGYQADSIDLSDVHFMRVLEVRLFPGHENDFAEAIQLWSQAHAKTNGDKPWVVYQVNDGSSSPTFLVFLPMAELQESDNLVAEKESILQATEGEGNADRLRQIVREAFVTTESNLYAVSPEMSHVPKDFAAGDLEFWRRGVEPEVIPEPKPSVSPSKKKAYAKPPQ